MTKGAKKVAKKCKGKKRVMLAYGITQLGTRLISAASLVAIALSLCSLKKDIKFFNDCIDEVREDGQTTSFAVRYCLGGE